MSKYKNLKIFIIFFLIVVAIAVPTQAQWGNTDFLKGLVPCGTSYAQAPCTTCHFYKLLQNLINFMLYTAASLATLMAAYIAFLFLFSGGSPQRITDAKSKLGLLVWGIVVVLGSWLVLNTIIVFFADPGAFPWPWNQIQCKIETSALPSPPPPPPPPPPPGTGVECNPALILGACQQGLTCTPTGKFRTGHTCEPVGSSTGGPRCNPSVGSTSCVGGLTCVAVNDGPLPQGECRQKVGPGSQPTEEQAQAQIILKQGTCGGTASCGGVNACSTLQAVASGQPPPVCFSGCTANTVCAANPNVHLSRDMLTALDAMYLAGSRYKIISLTTGSHSPNSLHYQGRAVDLVIDGNNTYSQLEQRLKYSPATYVQCEDSSGAKTSCNSSSVRHIHAEFR